MQQISESDYAINFFADKIKSSVAYEIIIVTPEVLKAVGHTIGKCSSNFVFIGFDRLDPLMLEKSTEIDGHVSIVSSVFNIDRIINNGKIYLYDVGFDKTDIPSDDIVYMSEEDLDSYINFKHKNKFSCRNRSIAWKSATDMRDLIIEQVKRADKINVLEYIKATQADQVELIMTDEGIKIEGNPIYLKGPFHYDFSGIESIDNDLIIIDEFGHDLEGVKLNGGLSIEGLY